VNPYNIREALLAKHAQHVVLIHFPIALCMAAAAYYNFTVAAISTVPVVATGLLAWQFALEGQKLKGVLLQHLVLGVASSAMICLIWYVHFRARREHEQTLPSYCLPMELFAIGLVAMTAHLGGYLSGVNLPS
jgi:uncharacterized membrane protein